MKNSVLSSITISVFGVFVILTNSVFCIGQTTMLADCLSYEPSVVALEVKLTRKTFPGPPNYASVRKGDTPETYWLLSLEHLVCVDEDRASEHVNNAQKEIRLVQLVVDPQISNPHAGLIGKRVVTTGTLFGGINGPHHTPVLLTVTTLRERLGP